MKTIKKQTKKIQPSFCKVSILNQQELEKVEGGFPYGVTDVINKLKKVSSDFTSPNLYHWINNLVC